VYQSLIVGRVYYLSAGQRSHTEPAAMSGFWSRQPVAVLGLPVGGASGVAMILGRGATELEQLKAFSLLI